MRYPSSKIRFQTWARLRGYYITPHRVDANTPAVTLLRKSGRSLHIPLPEPWIAQRICALLARKLPEVPLTNDDEVGQGWLTAGVALALLYGWTLGCLLAAHPGVAASLRTLREGVLLLSYAVGPGLMWWVALRTRTSRMPGNARHRRVVVQRVR